jgi:hypothetical protein
MITWLNIDNRAPQAIGRRDLSAQAASRSGYTRAPTHNARDLQHGSRGFAMIIPVVALAAVGGVLTTAVIASRGMSHQTAALEELIRSDINVESGLRRLVAAFADPADGLELVALAVGADIEVGEASLTLRVEPEAGKIDVIKSDEQLVRRYLSQAGGDTDTIWPKLSHLRQTGDGEAAFQAIALALAEVRGV